MVSCHLLLGKLWYIKHNVAYDCLTHRYTVKMGKKCNLVPMGADEFIAWRRDQKKIKEDEAKKNMVEAAEISIVVIQSAGINIPDKIDTNIIAEEIDLKPRTVSF